MCQISSGVKNVICMDISFLLSLFNHNCLQLQYRALYMYLIVFEHFSLCLLNLFIDANCITINLLIYIENLPLMHFLSLRCYTSIPFYRPLCRSSQTTKFIRNFLIKIMVFYRVKAKVLGNGEVSGFYSRKYGILHKIYNEFEINNLC